MELFPAWGCFFVVLKTASAYSKAEQEAVEPLTWDAEKDQREQQQQARGLHGGWMSCGSRDWLLLRKLKLGSLLRWKPRLYVHLPHWGCVCLCMFIFALSTLILEQHFQSFVSVIISKEVSCAVSQEGCFFINASHEKFRCVRYTLCIFILSEIHDSFLLKDHRKFLQAKERLYKLLSDFLCVHLSVPIFVQCFFTRKTLNEMLP